MDDKKAAAEFKAQFTVYSHLKWQSRNYTLHFQPSAPTMNCTIICGGLEKRA